jgi:hypothetical protein
VSKGVWNIGFVDLDIDEVAVKRCCFICHCSDTKASMPELLLLLFRGCSKYGFGFVVSLMRYHDFHKG